MKSFVFILLFGLCLNSCSEFDNYNKKTNLKQIKQEDVDEKVEKAQIIQDLEKIDKDLNFNDRVFLLFHKFSKDRYYNGDSIDGDYFKKISDLIYSDDIITIVDPKYFGLIPDDLPALMYTRGKLTRLAKNSINVNNLFFQDAVATSLISYACLVEALEGGQVSRAKNCRDKLLQNLITTKTITSSDDQLFDAHISKFNQCRVCELALEKKICNALYFKNNSSTEADGQIQKNIMFRFVDKLKYYKKPKIDITFYTDHTFSKNTSYRKNVVERLKITEDLIFKNLMDYKKNEIKVDVNQKKLLKSEKNKFFKDSVVICISEAE